MPPLHAAAFRADVTVPIGHPLCGGWIPPAARVADPLSAVGVVLLGGGAPVVLAALDWTTLANGGHAAFRRALADAAHTTPDRVAVHCVHPHDAPMADPDAERLVAEAGTGGHVLDLDFFRRCVDRVAESVRG